MTGYQYGKNLDGDTRQKDQDWAINYISPDTARLAVQMDLRDELKRLNNQLSLSEMHLLREMNFALHEILEQQKQTNRLLQAKRQPKRSKRNVNARRTRRKSSKR